MSLSSVSNVLLNTAPIFITVLLGYIAKQKNWLGKNAASVVSSLTFKIVVPFLVFKVLYGLKFDKENIGFLLLGIVIFGILLGLSFLISSLLKLSNKKKAVFILAISGFGIGSFAYAFILENFPNEVFQNVVLFDIVLFSLMITIGYAIAIFYGKIEKPDFKYSLKKIFGSPIILTIVGTLILNYLNIGLQNEVLDGVTFISSSFGFLASFLLGLTLVIPKFSDLVKVGGVFIGRTILVLVLLFVIQSIIGFASLQFNALLLSLVTPFGTMPVIYAEEQKLDEEYASQLIVISITISLFLYPLLIIFLV